ncbi:MAG: DUF523 and DUF1722 domain-containing protein [Gammaproteobacteria bacterium]|nr:DUF523 and DUF1722 domain-containing protein [Gammaproteobacteria bacterium]
MNKQNELTELPLVGVSACLAGQPVRFDGGHKHDRFITSSLSEHMKLLPLCPEMAIGLGVPRPSIQLRMKDDEVRLVVSKDPDTDLTEKMNNYAAEKLSELSHLDGFIFKKGSPSCGVFRVPVVVNEEGFRNYDATGVFAKAFMERYPLIPVEEEGRLNDAALRENFFERLFAYRRWKALEKGANNVQRFIEFHSRHKLMLMARGSSYYQELGRMVAGTTATDLLQRRAAYIKRFMEVMKLMTPPGRHVNVLQHIQGYLKKVLSREDKQELLSVYEAYRQKQLPLITPITLLRHHLRVNPQSYIGQQYYLQPFPEKLALRSVL